MPRPRFRDYGLSFGRLPSGEKNSLTDVPGVRVGHTTLISGAGPLRPGRGPVRTGVTVVLPHEDDPFQAKVPAAVYTINGFGKVFGFEQVRELGQLESPVALTNTLNVGLVADALIQAAVERNPGIGVTTTSVNVVVGETNDGLLNDIQGRHVRRAHVLDALHRATAGTVEEGNVGAGTGTICFGWKGGIGSASRLLPQDLGGFCLGALVQANFGRPENLLIASVPVGEKLQPPSLLPPAGGSVMIILATDAPLGARQLWRLCKRAAAGLALTGGRYEHSSGDFVLAFSTAYRISTASPPLIVRRPALANEGAVINALFGAVIESVAESVWNALFCAQTMSGRDDHIAYGLPVERVQTLLKE